MAHTQLHLVDLRTGESAGNVPIARWQTVYEALERSPIEIIRTSPTRTGMCSGSLSCWPGVGGVDWLSVSV